MKTGWKKTIAPLVLVLGAVALAACGGSDNKTDSGAAAGTDAAAPTAGTLIIGTDLPLQGASADASADTNLAIKLLLEKVGNKAGDYNVEPQGVRRLHGRQGRVGRRDVHRERERRTSPTRPRSPSWAPTTPAARRSRCRS